MHHQQLLQKETQSPSAKTTNKEEQFTRKQTGEERSHWMQSANSRPLAWWGEGWRGNQREGATTTNKKHTHEEIQKRTLVFVNPPLEHQQRTYNHHSSPKSRPVLPRNKEFTPVYEITWGKIFLFFSGINSLRRLCGGHFCNNDLLRYNMIPYKQHCVIFFILWRGKISSCTFI